MQPDHVGKHPFYITSFDAFTRADHSRNLPSASAAYGGNAGDGELPPLCNVVCGGSPWGGQRYGGVLAPSRSEEHTFELQSLMRISYAVFLLKKHTIQQIT